MCKSCFHAVYTFNHNIFKGAGRHIKHSSKRQTGKLVAHFLSDVTKQIESGKMTHSCGNCVEENIPNPENRNNSTLLEEKLPVADAGKKLLNNPRNHKIRCYTARHTQKGKEHTCDVLSFFLTCKFRYPADKAFLCRIFFLR